AVLLTQQRKPDEVVILVGQVGDGAGHNELYHLLFDGSVTDEKGYVAMGGRSEELTSLLKDRYREGSSLDEVVSVAASSLAEVEHTAVDVANLEAAVLDRTRGRRKFHRLTDQELDGMVSARR